SAGVTAWQAIGGTVREYYPDRIYYTTHNGKDSDRRVELHYRPRRDDVISYQYGTRYERTQLLDHVASYAQGQKVFDYVLDYEEPPIGADGIIDADHLHQR